MKDTTDEGNITEEEMETAYFLFSEFEDYIDYSDSLSEDNNKIRLRADTPQYEKDCFDEYKKFVDGIQKRIEEYDRKHGYIRPIR